MINYILSEHATAMLKERNLKELWIQEALNRPDKIEIADDGTNHYIHTSSEYGERFLRVIVNPDHEPIKVITVFFDRRIRRLL